MSMTEDFKKLGDDYWQWQMKVSPFSATFLGDHRYDDRLGELGPESRKQNQASQKSFLERLNKIDFEKLNVREKVSYKVLKLELSDSLKGYKFKDWEWDINQLFGVHMRLLRILEIHPLKTKKNFEDLIKRYEALPRFFDQYMGDLKDGLASGRVAPYVAYDRVCDQLSNLLAIKPMASSFAKPLKDCPSELKTSFETAIREKVYPAFQKLQDFLKNEYKGKARQEVGVSAIPDGRENYAHRARVSTTTELTPEQLHQMGLDELEKNKNEMIEIAQSLGHTGDLRSFQEKIKADRSNYFKTEKELILCHQSALDKMAGLLPKYFGTIHKTPFEIKPVDALKAKDSPAAYYYPPSTDGTRGGIFWMNTLKPDEWPSYSMETLAYHEAIPGHHLQIALASEQEDIPMFQRHGGFTAYCEGWAHYTELLADEMGAYSTELHRMGMLMDQAWRAIRLVVDTGVHYLGWSRQKAKDFMAEMRTTNEMELNNEIDRYITWPGQALAYKVGQRAFSDNRAWAQKELGEQFNIKEFHDVVLLCGSVPLTVLEEIVKDWVKSKKGS